MRANYIVPVAMKLVFLEIDRSKLCVRHFDAFLIMPFVEFCVNTKAFSRGSMPNQIDHHCSTKQRSAAPILGDMTEHSVLNLIPLTGTRGEMTDRDAQSALIRQSLEAELP